MLDSVSGARRSTVVTVVVGSLIGVVSTACSSGDENRLVVLAASSLTDVFDRIELEFEATHPDIDVVMSYGGSSALVTQVADGAPADVLATADFKTMARLPAGSLAGEPVVFARNSMVIAVEPGNPLAVDSVADLVDVPVVVLADAEVPAGAYARAVIECVGVRLDVASFEQNVRAAAAKVALGEADVALVYRTDIGDDLAAVEIEPACNVVADYPIVAVSESSDAQMFVDFVIGDAGAASLSAAGFEVP